MDADEPPLDVVAGAILDGTPIDWAAAAAAASAADRPLLHCLEQIAALADVHRGSAPETPGHLHLVERVIP